MSTDTFFQCQVGTSDPSVPLGLEIWVDQNKVFDQDHVTETHTVKHSLPDVEGRHQLRFVLKNKTQEHTKIDDNGNIIKDAVIQISDLSFEGIELGQMFFDLAEYRHDFNGTAPETTAKFYGTMGCNGTLTLEFDTPIYLWLLEKM